MGSLKDMREEIMKFVRLHPAQYTFDRLAEKVSRLTGYPAEAIDAETRAMTRAMSGKSIVLTASRTVAPGDF